VNLTLGNLPMATEFVLEQNYPLMQPVRVSRQAFGAEIGLCGDSPP